MYVCMCVYLSVSECLSECVYVCMCVSECVSEHVCLSACLNVSDGVYVLCASVCCVCIRAHVPMMRMLHMCSCVVYVVCVFCVW